MVFYSKSGPEELFLTSRGSFRQTCKSCNLYARGTFWRKIFVFTKFCFPKNFRTESDKCAVGLLKLFATFPEQNFKEKDTSSRKTHIICGFMREFLGLASFLSYFFRQGFHKCSLSARRSIRGKTFGVRYFFWFFKLFGVWEKNFRTLGHNCSAALSKMHSLCQWIILREILFRKIKYGPNHFLTSR